MSAVNVSGSEETVEPVYWALNGYGVTVLDLVMNLVILVVGGAVILLNALVFDTMIRLKPHKEPADVMVCSLALADLMTGVFLYYMTAYNMSNFQVYSECLIRNGLLTGIIVTSVLHLVVLSLDRYVKIIAPYRYSEWFTMRSMLIVSLILWFVSLIFALLPVMGWNTVPSDVEGSMATADVEDDSPVCSYFGILHADYLRTLVIIFWMPFLFMGVFYAHIFKVARRHAKLIAAQDGGQAGNTTRDRHSWKYTKTVVIIMGLYFICWIPCGSVIILFVLGDLKSWTLVEQGTLLVYTSAAAYINSLVNPIIYAFKISSVRRRFRQVFCCKNGQIQDETSIYTSAPKTKLQKGHCATIRQLSDGSMQGLADVSVT